MNSSVASCVIEEPRSVNASSFPESVSRRLICISHVVMHQAEHNPDATAILAHGPPPLTYGCLHRHISGMSKTLRAMGIRRSATQPGESILPWTDSSSPS
jgi:hypothetical protein